MYAGALNEIVRLFNDEGEVRAAALVAVQRAVASGAWEQLSETFFDMPVHYDDFEDFERRMMDVTFAERHLDTATREAVRARFLPHLTAQGADFVRPMRVNLLRKVG